MSNAETILKTVRRQLGDTKGRWSAVAEQSGVPYHTLVKIAQGTVEDPRVSTVQRLVDYFSKREDHDAGGTRGMHDPNVPRSLSLDQARHAVESGRLRSVQPESAMVQVFQERSRVPQVQHSVARERQEVPHDHA